MKTPKHKALEGMKVVKSGIWKGRHYKNVRSNDFVTTYSATGKAKKTRSVNKIKKFYD